MKQLKGSVQPTRISFPRIAWNTDRDIEFML
jgi:hypothetical protein